MFNPSGFKSFLKNGSKRSSDDAGLRLVPRSKAAIAEDAEGKRMAKTAMSKTLAEHDKVYHKNGFKDGDQCNFREALIRGDSVDSIRAAEKKESSEKYGILKYKEKPGGKKEIIGIENVTSAISDAAKHSLPPIESLAEMPSFDACKFGPYGDDDHSVTVECYGKKREWKSRKAAIMYYSTGASRCEGSEQERYQTIADYLMIGADNVTDDIDNPTDEMVKAMTEDAADESPISLQAHDRRFHPNGYCPGDRCQFREALSNGDDIDAVMKAEKTEAYIGKVNRGKGKKGAGNGRKDAEFTDANVREFAEKWLSDQGSEWSLSENGGVQDDGILILSFDGVHEDGSDDAGSMLCDLMEEIQDKWSKSVYFGSKSPMWSFDPARDRDGSYDTVGTVSVSSGYRKDVHPESVVTEFDIDFENDDDVKDAVEIMSDDIGELTNIDGIIDAMKARDRKAFSAIAQRLSNHAISEIEEKVGKNGGILKAIVSSR